MTHAFLRGIFLHCLLAVLAAAIATPTARAGQLTITPPSVLFNDAYEGRQVLVAQDDHDITRVAVYASSDPAVVRVDGHGYLRPVGDGTAQVRVTHGSVEGSVAVQVRGFRSSRPIDFRREIEPQLSRLGCNAGGCHGKASGQNGFKLSLFGFDAAFDHEAIAFEARGRRIFPAAPAQSLLLLKATAQVPHGGGKRMSVESPEYSLLLRWIEAGAPRDRGERPGCGAPARDA